MNTDQKLIDAMICEFEKYDTVERAVLFGSRARGDNTERSDYDIAVYGNLSQREITELSLSCDDELPTLHKIDLVFMQRQNPSDFTANIEREGIIIYDKAKK